jgi:hypothetical protein
MVYPFLLCQALIACWLYSCLYSWATWPPFCFLYINNIIPQQGFPLLYLLKTTVNSGTLIELNISIKLQKHQAY